MPLTLKRKIFITITGIISLFLYMNNSENSGEIRSNNKEVKITTQFKNKEATAIQDTAQIYNSYSPTLWLRKQFDLILLKAKESKAKQVKYLTVLHNEMKLNQSDYLSLDSLFNRYLAYKLKILNDKKSLTSNHLFPGFNDNRKILERLKHHQKSYFSNDEIRAFFADEMRLHKQALSRMAITADKTLNKLQALDVLEAEIRTQDISQQEAFLPSIKLARMTQALNDDSVYVPEMSLAAEERFLTFKSKHQNWKNRVKDFIKKIEIIKSKQTDVNEAQNEVNQLRAEHFKPNEIQRLDVFLRHPKLLTSS